MKRGRLLMTLANLNAGGVERVLLALLRHPSRDRFKIDLALVHR
jgi:hypothetical protein